MLTRVRSTNGLSRKKQDSFFNSFFDDFFNLEPFGTTSVQSWETWDTRNKGISGQSVFKDNQYQIELQVPGHGKEDLELSIDNEDLLVVTSKKEGNPVLWEERVTNSDVEKLEATCDKGILFITIPIVAATKPEKRIIKIK